MTQQLLLSLSQYGLWAVLLNVLLNQIGLPLPAVPTLIVAGAVAAGGQLHLAAVFFGSIAACLVADCGWYLVGQVYGMRVLRTLCRISLEPDYCVNQTQLRFERWGVNSLVIAKFVPGLSTIAPPMAGAMRIGWPRFIFLSALSAALWVGAGLVTGMLFSSQIERLLRNLDQIGSLAVMGALILLGGYVGFKWWERRRFFKTLRMARISVAELFELIRAGAEPLIIDVRSPSARALEPQWIPGALHISLPDVGPHLKDLPRNRDIILYCTCPNEASAASVAKILMNHGFKRVRPLHGGLDAWRAAGYTVATSSAAASASALHEA
ncbi:MAG TPA: DedA family protein/thiosulfate sulfurtransferase GlpE [Steroidobacteraceae bacterium]|nr:DedA family protein/thiosulfate sulfurtransferase GlpE [Steroidobacteraceae bacterium]